VGKGGEGERGWEVEKRDVWKFAFRKSLLVTRKTGSDL